MKVCCFVIFAIAASAVAEVSPTWKPYIEKHSAAQDRLNLLRDLMQGAEKRSPKNLRLVASALSDPSDYVRTTALFALQDNKSATTFKALMQEIQYAEQNQGAQLLSGYREDRYLKQMTPLLKHPNPNAQWIAIQGMGLTMNRKAFWPLISALNHLDAPLRWRVSISAMRFDTPNHRLAALKLLDDKNPRCRDVAADLMGFWKEPRGVNKLIAQLADKDSEAAWSALVALGHFHDSKTKARIFREFSNKDPIQRGKIATILGLQGGGEYVDPLFKAMLDDPSEPVRQDCLRALIKIGKPSIPKMLELAVYENPRERGTAVIALGEIALPEGKPALLKAITDSDAVVRMFTATALGSFRGADIEEALMQATKDAEPRVRDAAAKSLAKIRISG